MKNLVSSAALVGALVLAGCNGSSDIGVEALPDSPVTPAGGGSEEGGGSPANEVSSETPPEPAEPPPVANHCDFGKRYVGFAGTELEAGRVDNVPGIDRARLKPFSALGAEYRRVLGNTPALVSTMGSTFGQPPARWYVEPQASAITLYSAYRVAFQGCLTYTASPAKYASVPSSGTAATECAALAHGFWSRTATQEEIDACVKVATVDTAKETDPRRRWAYACASVLTAAGFLTY